LKNIKFTYRINNQINAPKVRVLNADGSQLGVMKLSDALREAINKNLDLIEIVPNANPPVCKITQLGKLKYEAEKKARKEKKGSKGGDTKEIRFTPFIGQADYDTRVERIREFLSDKNKVRVVVKFGGRQMGSKQFGYDLVKRIFNEFEGNINIDMPPKFLGRHLTTVISPLNKIRKDEKNEKQTEDKKDSD